MSWNPSQYLKYEDLRLRPALDLMARIPLAAPSRVVDLGCGAGNVARVLAARFPGAVIDGVDSDAAMLGRARDATRGDARFRWHDADLARWRPEGPVDLVFSNAALHWLDGHDALFPAVFAQVAAGGVLAVQMPDMFAAPSHLALFETAESPRWAPRTAAAMRKKPVAALERYHALLAPEASSLDLWRTSYLQVLASKPGAEHPVVAWMRGAALTPFIAALGGDAEAFVAEFAARVERAYPRGGDGGVYFPFSRVFIVATRR